MQATRTPPPHTPLFEFPTSRSPHPHKPLFRLPCPSLSLSPSQPIGPLIIRIGGLHAHLGARLTRFAIHPDDRCCVAVDGVIDLVVHGIPLIPAPQSTRTEAQGWAGVQWTGEGGHASSLAGPPHPLSTGHSFGVGPRISIQSVAPPRGRSSLQLRGRGVKRAPENGREGEGLGKGL